MLRSSPLLLTLCACQPGGGAVLPGPTGTSPTLPTTGGTTTTTTTGSTTTTTTTPPTPTGVDCTVLPPTPAPFASVGYYSDAEDFEFDTSGNVVVAWQRTLLARDYSGDTDVLAAGLSDWMSGTRILSTGDWALADSQNGRIIVLDAGSGAQTTVASNFSWPNAIEVSASGDDLYISEFSDFGYILRVNAYNPNDNEVVASGLARPNGVALSPDERTLYVVESWSARLLAYDLNIYGVWEGPRVLIDDPNGNYQGLNVDICGNIYLTDVEVSPPISHIWRVTPDGSQVDLVADIPSGYVPNIRWGSGIGGWDEEVAYVSDRDQGLLFGIEVGIRGKPHVAIP